MQEDQVYKLILVGDQSVGKSSILSMFTHRTFKKDYNVTIGLEFGSRAIQLSHDNYMTLQIWDTAGQEAFKSIIRSFYRNSASVFIVYNVTKRETFDSIDAWVKEIQEHANPEIILGIIGNKMDLESLRQVGFEEGQEKASQVGAHIFFEASAMNGNNIEEMFQAAAQFIQQKATENQDFRSSIKSKPVDSFAISQKSKDKQANQDAQAKPEKKKSGCC